MCDALKKQKQASRPQDTRKNFAVRRSTTPPFAAAGMLPVRGLADLVAAAGTVGTGIRVNGDRVAILWRMATASPRLPATWCWRRGAGWRGSARRRSPHSTAPCRLRGAGRNPVNLFADATAARYRDALGPLLADAGVDAIVAINAPTAVGDTLAAASAVADRLARERKPVAAAWLEESTRDEARRVFANRRIPLHEVRGRPSKR